MYINIYNVYICTLYYMYALVNEMVESIKIGNLGQCKKKNGKL